MSFRLRPLVDDKTFLFPPQTMDALGVVLGADPDQIAAAIAAYFVAHPIAGATREIYTQSTPLGQWGITHGLGYAPTVTVFLSTGERIVPDYTSTSTTAAISFATPTSGFAVLI